MTTRNIIPGRDVDDTELTVPSPTPPREPASSNTQSADAVADSGGGGVPLSPPPPPAPPTLGSSVAAPPVTLANTTLPAGAGLLLVRFPRGSDANNVYYMTLELFGVQVAFEIGDPNAFKELIPEGESVFESKVTVNGQPPDEYVVGPMLADSGWLGVAESAQSVVERELAALEGEGVANWIRQSPEAMTTLVLANTNGWSPGKTWNELAKTDAFNQRFTGISLYLDDAGGNVQAAVGDYVAEESRLRDVIRAQRGGAFDITNDYLGQLIGAGWTATTAEPFLQAETQLRRNPDALRQANAILTASGLPAIDETGLVSVMTGAAAPEIADALSAAAAAQALQDAGLQDLDLDLIADVVDVTTLRTPDDYRAVASELAFNLVRFAPELSRNDLGLTEDDVVGAFLGNISGGSPSGKSYAEVVNTMARFERDRRAGGQGVTPVTSFLNNRGRLVTPGLTALG